MSLTSVQRHSGKLNSGFGCVPQLSEHDVNKAQLVPKVLRSDVSMPEEPELSLEVQVLRRIMGAFKSREVLEAQRPDYVPPYDDKRALFQGWGSTVDRQGVILAHLSIVPATRAELMSRMPGLLESAPAWLDAHLEGQKAMTAKLFMRGLAQTLGEHRSAIERVVAEQVADIEAVEEALEEASVPPGTEDETQSELIHGVGKAMTAHTKALVEIAHDLETQVGRRIEL